MRYDGEWYLTRRWLVILLFAFVALCIALFLTEVYLFSVDIGGYYDPNKADWKRLEIIPTHR